TPLSAFPPNRGRFRSPLAELYLDRIALPAGLTSINMARAWYGTAVLFAAAHSGVWPSPIPLTALAFALGWLAYRTQSLISSMVFHSLFNSITVVVLIVKAMAG